MLELKTLAGIGAVYIVTAISGYLLPVPHIYQSIYAYVYGPVGALAGYGIANVIVERAPRWHPIIVWVTALIGAVVCASFYWQLYNSERSPSLEARMLHAGLYALSFAFFFFLARWAGFLFRLNKKENKEYDNKAYVDITGQGHNLREGVKKVLVLFIHGLGGDKIATWGRFPEILRHDQQIAKDYQLEFFSYPTMLWRHLFSRKAPRIQELAAGLRTQIENRYASFENIILVCHSLGGLVARQYVLEDIKAKREPRVSGIVLIAVPNNGADLARIGAFLSVRHQQLRQLCRDSDLIEFLNTDWFTMGLNRTVRAKYIIGTQDGVVDRLSAQVFWGNPNVEVVIGKNHRDIVKPLDSNDDVVIILKRFLQGTLQRSEEPAGDDDKPTVQIDGPATAPLGKKTFFTIISENAIRGEWSAGGFHNGSIAVDPLGSSHEIYVEPTDVTRVRDEFIIVVTVYSRNGTSARATKRFSVVPEGDTADKLQPKNAPNSQASDAGKKRAAIGQATIEQPEQQGPSDVIKCLETITKSVDAIYEDLWQAYQPALTASGQSRQNDDEVNRRMVPIINFAKSGSRRREILESQHHLKSMLGDDNNAATERLFECLDEFLQELRRREQCYIDPVRDQLLATGRVDNSLRKVISNWIRDVKRRAEEVSKAVGENRGARLSADSINTTVNAHRSRNEAISSNEGGDTTKFVDEVQCIFLTAIPEEYHAVCRHIEGASDVRAWTIPAVVGTISNSKVLCVLSGKGGGNTAAALQYVAAKCPAKLVIMVGVAGGFPSQKVVRGNVVIARHVQGYDFGKLTGGQYIRRPELDFPCDIGLVRHAELIAEDTQSRWHESITTPRPDNQSPTNSNTKVHVGYVASGDKIVDDADHVFFRQVLDVLPEVHAVEMETAGAGASIRLLQTEQVMRFVMIKGISDQPAEPGDSREQDSGTDQRLAWKPFAADAAATLAELLIRKLSPAAKGEGRGRKIEVRLRARQVAPGHIGAVDLQVRAPGRGVVEIRGVEFKTIRH
jgi:nucleoside phosphorylase/pimeloyl-ACP methyl ester carboxylesterase